MKQHIIMKQFIAATITVALLSACSQPDKKAQLEKLKTQYAELGKQIETLEG